MSETVDGVKYVETRCVDCGTPMSVSADALRVMHGQRWPRCSACQLDHWNAIGKRERPGGGTTT